MKPRSKPRAKASFFYKHSPRVSEGGTAINFSDYPNLAAIRTGGITYKIR